MKREFMLALLEAKHHLGFEACHSKTNGFAIGGTAKRH